MVLHQTVERTALTGQLRPSTDLSDYPTNQELMILSKPLKAVRMGLNATPLSPHAPDVCVVPLRLLVCSTGCLPRC